MNIGNRLQLHLWATLKTFFHILDNRMWRLGTSNLPKKYAIEICQIFKAEYHSKFLVTLITLLASLVSCSSLVAGAIFPPPKSQQPLVCQGLLIIGASRPHSRHSTVGRTPLDEWSARKDLYLTIHNNLKRQTYKFPAGFEPQSQQTNAHRHTPYNACH